MKLKDYCEYMRLNHDEDPIYMFDDKFPERETTKCLLNEYEVPIYFKVRLICNISVNTFRKIILMHWKKNVLLIAGFVWDLRVLTVLSIWTRIAQVPGTL
jgi:hypothetical protein